MQPHWNTVNIRCHLEVGVEAIVLFSLKRCWARDNTSDVNKTALSQLFAEGRTGSSSSRSRWWYETVMVRGGTMGAFFVLLVILPVTMANSFVGSPGEAIGEVTGSAALEWTLQSEPGRYDVVGFTFNGDDVFRYIPYTGVILWRVIEGPDGNPIYTNASYDPRFSIHNTSTRGVGVRLAGLRLEDAGTYTCRYESLSPTPITTDAVLVVYETDGVLNASPGEHTVPCESEFWTTDTPHLDLIGGSFSGISIMIAIAGGVILIVIVVTVVCVRRKGKPASESVNSEVLGEPGHSTSDYVNFEMFGEPGQPVSDYINPDVFREPGQSTGDYITTGVFREPGQPASDYVNSEICRKPTSAGHPPAGASGHYESMDMATREPADPINRVYEALQQ